MTRDVVTCFKTSILSIVWKFQSRAENESGRENCPRKQTKVIHSTGTKGQQRSLELIGWVVMTDDDDDDDNDDDGGDDVDVDDDDDDDDGDDDDE